MITNKLGLPKPFVSAVERDYQYKDKQYSVTTILKDVREILLSRRHHAEIEQDVADMIWLILGTAVHSVLENSTEGENEFKEEHFVQETENGYKLSGQADLFNAEKKMVTDYKTCSVWKVIKDEWEDYRKQLLMYAWAFRKMGFEVNKGQIVAVIKDHSKMKAKIEKNYPKYPVYVKEFEFSEEEFKNIEEFINQKFDEIKKYENTPDEELPLCSPESRRFNAQVQYAIMKKGAKRAVKVHDSLEEAEIHLKQLDDNYSIEIREPEEKKCIEYCTCCKFCDYWRTKYEEKEKK